MPVPSPTSLTVADLLRGDIQLVSPPNVYFLLSKIIDDPGKCVADAASVIQDDAALTIKLLKIVNSAFYGFPAQVSSIERAVSLIGMRELQNLVLAMVVVDRFSDMPGMSMSVHDFWARNLRCALLAREIDRQTGKRHAETAFVAGILHNIGQLVLYRRIPVLAREIDLLLQSRNEKHVDDEVRMETSVIGFDHYQVGAELCRLWKLPEQIVASIAMHCFPNQAGEHADIAAVVRLANALSHVENPEDLESLAALDLSPEQLGGLVDSIGHEFEAIFKLFYA